MAELDSHQVRFRIVGTADLQGKVLASVFAQKLAALVRAMEAADKAANGQQRFDFVIVDLKPTSASATLREFRISSKAPDYSSVEIFERCVRSVDTQHYQFAREHLECVKQLVAVAKDVAKTYDHAEITVDNFETVVIDETFLSNATEAITIPDPEVAEAKWFKGVTVGSFDGKILETDIRHSTPKFIVRLTAGGKEITCDCPGFSIDDIRTVLGRRVRLTGRAHYDGTGGLPSKIEVIEKPRLIKENPDFARWRGTFETFTIDDWHGDN
ncbi:hypothetical protein [Mesorhizobium sp. LNJC391B00]|uniref:hypothetical protein n=1 Tax=Mesorhizobium sp. LNJC391B00 TaxID=1287273 RepID=UPI0012EC555F|nr:hypothetical protein [Mesorhizobium sp. LNJC391B00]